MRVVSRLPKGPNGAQYAVLMAALVAPSFNFVALPPVLPDIAMHFGGGARGQGIAQMAQALPFLGLAVGGLVAGWILVRLGVRASIVFAALGLIVGGMGGIGSDRLFPLLASCVLLGFMSSLATAVLTALTASLVDGSFRDRLLGIQVAVSDICTVAGAISAAMLASRFGWHGPFLIFILLGLYLLLLLVPARIASGRGAFDTGGLARVAKRSWRVYAGGVFIFLLVATQATQLPFYLEQLGYHTASGRAVITTFALVAAMCGSISFALLLGRIAAWRLLAAAVASTTAGFLGLAFWDGQLAIGLGLIFLVGLGSGLVIPSLFTAVLRQAPEGLRGHSIGLLNVAIFAGSFVSPAVLSPIAAALGYPGLYAVMATTVLAVGSARVMIVRGEMGRGEQCEGASEEGVTVNG